jgi:predicted MPP superfamily phosphohydrolase
VLVRRPIREACIPAVYGLLGSRNRQGFANVSEPVFVEVGFAIAVTGIRHQVDWTKVIRGHRSVAVVVEPVAGVSVLIGREKVTFLPSATSGTAYVTCRVGVTILGPGIARPATGKNAMTTQILRALFFLAFFAVLLWGHVYLWRKMVRDTGITGRPRRVFTTFFCVGFLLIPITLGLAQFMSPGELTPIVVPAFLWLGIMAYLFMFLAPFECVRVAIRRLKDGKDVEVTHNGPEETRRLFLSRASVSVAAMGSAMVTGFGVRSAVGDITKPVVEIKLPRLPKALSGFKIVQLSDIHIGSVLGVDFLNYVVAETNALRPDMVVITGDLVDSSVRMIGADIAHLRNLKSRHGTYFVTGNHEYYSNAAEWVPFLRKIGLKVLMNERVSIGDSAFSFDLAGVPDDRGGWYGQAHAPDLAQALKGRDPERELVFLAHRPTAIKWAETHEVGLQLSGHTHGGQFFPLEYIIRLMFPYVAGHHHHNELTQIYVSRGTGFWGPPMRVASPAEITTIVLTA